MVNLPKLNMPHLNIQKPANMWNQAVKSNTGVRYVRESPLIPQKCGYPIQLNQRTSGSPGIKLEDLESEPAVVTNKVSGGERMRYVATYNPYAMKGSTAALREQNRPLEAENAELARELGMPTNKPFKAPTEPYKPLLNPNARQSTRKEQEDALMNAELEKRSKAESEAATETFRDNERRASNPAGDPIWIQRTPGQGPRKDFIV